MEIKKNILTLFDSNIDDIYYSEVFGFNKNVPVYRKFTHLYAKIFFKVLEIFDLDYYVFAGTSIGYIRNKKNIPWVDDYDIIIFEEEVKKFENIIIPKLNDLGFNCFKPYKISEGWHVLSKFGQKCFQCDIFFTKINNCGIIYNSERWGLYNSKNIHIDIVKPKEYLTIDDDLTIPFFNVMSEDVQKEYGDVINECVFHINHGHGLKIIEHYSKVYESFNHIHNSIINNAKIIFDSHIYINNETLVDYDYFIKSLNFQDNKVLNHIEFLKYIKNKNIKNLNIMDERFLIFCPDIKYYFKDTNINFYMSTNLDNKNIMLLNYIDNVFCSKKQYIDYLEECDILLLNKPNIDYIRAITFGTYDLFHIGHTNILKRAKNYGELFVGVSTDELNIKKGKQSVNNLKQRKHDVKNNSDCDHIFDEESMELKNEYVKNYNCNLLIMGDDWKNAFNFCDCACIYLERTSGISTSMLKEKLFL